MTLTFVILILAGLIGGFLAGLVGIGGGIIYVFVLQDIFTNMGVPNSELAQFTIANSTFAVFFASVSANYTLIKGNEFYWRSVAWVSIGGLVTAFLLQQLVVNTPWFSKDTFNIIVLVALIYMFVKAFIQTRTPTDPIHPDRYSALPLSATGAAGGIMAAVSGLGGGVIMIPILNTFMKIDIKVARSISSGVISVTSLMLTINNLQTSPLASSSYQSTGYIIFPIAAMLTAGVVVSAPFGVKAARTLSSKTISYIYLCFLSVFIIKKTIEIFG